MLFNVHKVLFLLSFSAALGEQWVMAGQLIVYGAIMMMLSVLKWLFWPR